MATYLSITHSGPTLTLNKAKGAHWSKTSPIIDQWKADFAILGKMKRLRMHTPVGIEVYVTSRDVGGVGDAAAHAYCAKGAIDGLVVAGVLIDDDGERVAWQRFHAPRRELHVPAGLIRLTLELVSPADKDAAPEVAGDVALGGRS